MKLKVLIDWLVDHLNKKLKMGDALEALRAGQLHVNFEGGRVSGEILVSAFPAKSMFLLSRGKLAEEYRGHRGRVWQCQLCSRADSKRNNVIKARCTSKNGKHRCYFDEDQLAKLGDHAASKGGRPMYLIKVADPEPSPGCLPLAHQEAILACALRQQQEEIAATSTAGGAGMLPNFPFPLPKVLIILFSLP